MLLKLLLQFLKWNDTCRRIYDPGKYFQVFIRQFVPLNVDQILGWGMRLDLTFALVQATIVEVPLRGLEASTSAFHILD